MQRQVQECAESSPKYLIPVCLTHRDSTVYTCRITAFKHIKDQVVIPLFFPIMYPHQEYTLHTTHQTGVAKNQQIMTLVISKVVLLSVIRVLTTKERAKQINSVMSLSSKIGLSKRSSVKDLWDYF